MHRTVSLTQLLALVFVYMSNHDMILFFLFCLCLLQAGLIETNGEIKVFIDQNMSPSKGTTVGLVSVKEQPPEFSIYLGYTVVS